MKKLIVHIAVALTKIVKNAQTIENSIHVSNSNWLRMLPKARK